MAPAEGKKKLVKKACKMKNPIVDLNCVPIEQTLDGEALSYLFLWGTHLNNEQFTWVFDLFNKNMRSYYEKSQWGYDAENKKQELQATTSRYVLVRNSVGRYVAFCHYRFCMDHASAVVYCYEIQVEPDYQSKGVGTLLISMLITVCERTGMDKVMATVFAFNEKSLGFFHKLGFAADITCPDAEQGLDYLILSHAIS
ncbi:hypothetical protein AB6A40_002103 [Gnathostoma spinigerum]|uniref:N-alpha-acetyltransferase 40 n=1 Tax=Gnathostoma spinigerum TaxID=75299 RepID=A0ABD6EDH2_9BILA